jgi:hypothetical protein
MPDIKLGISGSEVTLPIINSLGGAVPNAEVARNKEIQKAVMSDGSPRYGLLAMKREWPLEWGLLTYAQVTAMIALHALNVALRYQDNNESATWYDVTIISFRYRRLRGISSATTSWYSANMVLAEV